jgi:hypothetical protein
MAVTATEGAPGPFAGHDHARTHEPIGSVASEAALLVHELAARAATRAASAHAAAYHFSTQPVPEQTEEPQPTEPRPGSEPTPGSDPAAGSAGQPEQQPRAETPGHEDQPPRADEVGDEELRSSPACPTCGCGATGVCASCPVCRASTVVKMLSPTLLDSVAEVASLAARGLRQAAARQRDANGWSSGARDADLHDVGPEYAAPADKPWPPSGEGLA